MSETWYVMEDGSVGDPREIATDKDGILRHKDGRAVAYGPHGPRSRGGVDPEAERGNMKPARQALKTDPKPDADVESDEDEAKDMKPEAPRRKYKTRQMKAD